MLRVNQIFDSIQGEGIQVGRLTTFIRLQGCNLDCSWCDTGTAKDPAKGNLMSEDDVVRSVFHPVVTLTGGEPLLQKIDKLCQMLRLKKYQVHIETNGTFPEAVGGLYDLVDFWSVSPKIQAQRQAMEFVHMMGVRRLRGQIKFVIDAMDEVKNYNALKWVREFVSAVGPKTLPVVLQPCWIDPAITYMDRGKYEKRFKQMAYFIKQRWPAWDVRLIPQIHKMLALDRNCHKTIDRPKPEEE